MVTHNRKTSDICISAHWIHPLMCFDAQPMFYCITYFRLLVDSLIRSSMCWWDDPSMLTPLMVTIISPTMNMQKKGTNHLQEEDMALLSICASVCVGVDIITLCMHGKPVKACLEDVGGLPAVRPALSAALSSCTLNTNVHISTAMLSFSCRP